MLEAFIFDFDGTLANTYPVIMNAFNAFAVKYTGREWSIDEIVALFGPPEADIIGNLVNDELREEAIEYYYRAYRDLHRDDLLYEGIYPLLTELEGRGKKLAVFTGKGRRSTEITMKALGLEDKFRPVVTGDDVNNGKPHPEGLLKVVRELKVSPDKTAMIGDHRSDIVAGKAAGVFTIAALWHGYDNKALMRAGPDEAFESPTELLQWINNGAIAANY